jgi:hypothetical protein
LTPSRQRFIPQLLDTHAEDLAFHWGQRRAWLHSPDRGLRDYLFLDDRIEAHVQGLAVAPVELLCARLDQACAAQERDDVLAAAAPLLRQGREPGVEAVLRAFAQADGTALPGLRDAFAFAAPAACVAAMRAWLDNGAPARAAAAAVVLTHHRALEPATQRLNALLGDEDAAVAAPAWQAALRADCQAPQKAPARSYDRALEHANRSVRDAAWACMAWRGEDQVLPRLRRAMPGGDSVVAEWLAVLGQAEDMVTVGAFALGQEPPHARCALLARGGHPRFLPLLTQWLEGDDGVLALEAQAAFTRITGEDIRGERRGLPPADPEDDFDREMAPLVWLPDPARARALLAQHGATWAAAERWCQGRRMEIALADGVLRELDFQCRWDATARAALSGLRLSAPPLFID